MYMCVEIGFLSHWEPYAVISVEAVAYSSYWMIFTGPMTQPSALKH